MNSNTDKKDYIIYTCGNCSQEIKVLLTGKPLQSICPGCDCSFHFLFGERMDVTKEEYNRIINGQLDGELTIFIDNPGFRHLFFKINPNGLSQSINQKVNGWVKTIKFISNLDIITLMSCCFFSIIAIKWWSIVYIPVIFISWFVYRSWACRGKQFILPVSFVVAAAIFIYLYCPTLTVFTRALLILSALVFFWTRLLYYLNSRFVFNLIHSNFNFFKLFYLKPDEGMPLIWVWKNDLLNKIKG